MSVERRSPRVFGPYEVLGSIGQGGMARVFAARHRQLRELRALKVVALTAPALQERFAREARLQGRVRHPNVLPVLDILRTDEGPAMVLPLVEGPTLAGLLEHHRLEPSDAVALFAQLVDGMAAVHAAGLVHRDLKPANVLLDPSGGAVVARIADFGLAKILDDGADPTLTRAGAALGTPAYMAPEQRADARHADARADVWALGCVLLELLVGRRHVAGGPISALPPEAAAWSRLLGRMLSPDPADRPADAAAVRALSPATTALGSQWVDRCRALAPEVGSVAATQWSFAEPASGNLPAERDAFVGRAGDLARMADRVDGGARLVTVVGPGGVGKTRLALRFAASPAGLRPGGAWFCDLSEARAIDGLCAAVAEALGVPLQREDPVAQLGHAIAGRGPCLVLLDNFEQVASLASATLGRWLDRCAEATFVVTSRQVLGLRGEAPVVLSPMEADDAVALFLLRAGEAKEGFAPDAAEQAAIARLVATLDHLPLAVELVAARSRAMSPRALLSRMGERFRLVASHGGRGDRHATLRATLDWSWNLLDRDEKRGLAQLSVFEGGFTLEAAEHVLEVGGAWVGDVVQSLVDKSLVRPVEEDRFDLLVSVQAYAAEKVEDDGAARRHGAWFALYGTWAPRDRRSSALVAVELENLLVACRRAIARGDGAVALATQRAAWGPLVHRGPYERAADLAQAVRAMGGLSERDTAEADRMVGDVMRLLARAAEGRAATVAALEGARRAGDRRLEATALCDLGILTATLGQLDEARRRLEEALAISRAEGDPHRAAIALSSLGPLHAQLGSADAGRAALEEALHLAREVGDARREALVLGNLGVLELRLGRAEAAGALLEGAIAISRGIGDRASEAVHLINLGNVRLRVGRLDQAQQTFEGALTLNREVGARRHEGTLLALLGNVELGRGLLTGARARFEGALALHEERQSPAFAALTRINLSIIALEEGRVEDAVAEAERAVAQLAGVGDVQRDANALAALGLAQVAQGRPEVGVATLEAALALYRRAADPLGQASTLFALGRARRLQGDEVAALGCLARAEALFREGGVRSELARLLAYRAAEADAPPGASRARLSEAEQLADALGVVPESPLRRELALARAALAQA